MSNDRSFFYMNRKGINNIVLIIISLIASTAISTGIFIYIKDPPLPLPFEMSSEDILDSLARRYSLDLDSLRTDMTFISNLQLDIFEDDVYEKILEYDDEYIRKELGNDTILVSDSLKSIIAMKELTEEKLLDFVEGNRDIYEMEFEIEKLKSEKQQLKGQIDTLSVKEDDIVEDSGDKDDKINKLEKENKELLDISNELKGKNFKALVKKFESMKPARASQIIQNMPDNEVVRMLKLMKNKQAAKILTSLPPNRSAIISLLIMKEDSTSNSKDAEKK